LRKRLSTRWPRLAGRSSPASPPAPSDSGGVSTAARAASASPSDSVCITSGDQDQIRQSTAFVIFFPRTRLECRRSADRDAGTGQVEAGVRFGSACVRAKGFPSTIMNERRNKSRTSRGRATTDERGAVKAEEGKRLRDRDGDRLPAPDKKCWKLLLCVQRVCTSIRGW
jgi:hypothetical protein